MASGIMSGAMNSDVMEATESPSTNLKLIPMPSVNGPTQNGIISQPSLQWSRWQELPDSTSIYAPAAVSPSANRIDVFRISTDSKMYHNWWDGSKWNVWTPLGDKVFTSAPTAISPSSNRIDVFGISTDKQIYRQSWNGSTWNEQWESLGGVCIHGLAATSSGPNRIDLFAVGTNSCLYHKWWDGSGWNGWEPLKLKDQMDWEKSSTTIYAPTAVVSENRINLFAVGIDNHIYQAWWDGEEWIGWEKIDGPCIQGIAVTSREKNLDLFTIGTDIEGTDNHLYHCAWDSSKWGKWENLGGACISAPTVVARGANRLDTFVIGTQNKIWQKSWAKEGGASVQEDEDKEDKEDKPIRASNINQEENPGENALDEIARVAASETGLNIELGSFKDIAVGWFGTNVHPLQELETIHQKVVKEAAQAFPKSSEERQNVEYEKLQTFFSFHSTEPELVKEDSSVVEKTLLAQFTLAKKELDAIVWDLSTSSLAQTNDSKYLSNTKQRLLNLLGKFETLQLSFFALTEDLNFKEDKVPILVNVKNNIEESKKYLNNQDLTCKDLKKASKKLITDVQIELGRAIEGLAKISMIFSIEPFYLFRLMVPFQVVSKVGVNQGDTRNASGKLTEIINNRIEWVPIWLESKILELDKALKELDPKQEDFFFHLKGGRAQANLLKTPGIGENDWDTGIVINPELPAEYWHQTFNEVRNLVLKKLSKFKQEFFMLIHLHAEEITLKMLQDRSRKDDELIDALKESNLLSNLLTDAENQQGSCKAELIDIGIPRRDSIEALEHWYHTRPYITRKVNEVPIPGHVYYVNEYLVMMRETISSQSPAPRKMTKRLRRLFDIMSMQDDDFDSIVKELRSQLNSTFPNSLKIVNQPNYIDRLIPVMLKQFMNAYNLANEPNLATAFDRSFTQQSQALPELKAPFLPQNALTAIENDSKNGSWNAGTHGTLLQWILLANQLSATYEQYFQNKANFFGFGQQPGIQKQNRAILEKFIKDFYNQSIFSENDDKLEVQLAICGSFAAYLHAESAQLTSKLKAQLEPVSCIELKIFSLKKDSDPKTIIDALVNPLLQNNRNFNVQDGANGEKYFFWTQQNVNIQPLANLQNPLVLKIVVEKNFRPQQIAFVRGFPVLSLRDLIREYDRKAALAEEWARVQRLTDTSAVLRGMLTQFDY